ncbi:MAG: hypothetical protein EFT35_07420 [Methanophagales archaeon ANME-1-THS]|nr:MAG: hypothetical protein EFT35_07420 [Methanophagales archaeon ANME-1-THS]
MMQKSVIVLIVILALSSTCVSVVSAEDFPVLDKEVEIRQAHLKWTAAIYETSMNAVIAYIDEISEGTGTSELISLRDDFKAQTEKIGTLTTHVALNNALRQLAQITTDFRLETRKQMDEHNGRYLELVNRVETALDENQEELDSLKNTYWEKREENTLAIFDIRVNRAQTILDTLQTKGYDTGEAQKKLDEIKAKRSGLEAALAAKDNLAIAQVHLEILSLSKELARIVRDLQVMIPQEVRVKHWLHVGDRVVAWTATIIAELETLGIDVAQLQSIHSQAETDLEKAHDAFDAHNFDEAIDALNDLKTDLIKLRDAYEELVFSGVLSGDMKRTVEATSAALDDTIKDMDASI